MSSQDRSIDVSVTQTVPGDPEAPEPARPKFGRGTTLGRYILLDVIGEGGMGVVFRAFDPELERMVAVKLLHSSVTDGSSVTSRRERLLREGKALARLSHPNVVSVFDVGTVDTDVFIATEFIEGETLGVWIRETKPSPREVLSILIQAGEGLAAAHKAGLVHRDVKPSNIIVDKGGRARVLDFGLARADSAGVTVDGRSSASSFPPLSPGLLEAQLTEQGQVLGTRRFMSPEQHKGEPADARSDQFSFCVTVYYALYGEYPFEGRGGDYIANVVKGEIRPTPQGARVPRRVRSALARGLSLAPSLRFPTIDALLLELERDAIPFWLRALTASVVALSFGGAGFMLRASHSNDPGVCAGAAQKLEGVWDDAGRQKLLAAWIATGDPEGNELFSRIRQPLDAYASRWVSMRTEACETRIRGEQSSELLDLRMQCLDERLLELRAQMDLALAAEKGALGKSIEAVLALPRIEACGDTVALRAPVKPPGDAAGKAVASAITIALANARALERSGNYAAALPIAEAAAEKATRLGHKPTEAEALYVVADIEDDLGEYKRSEEHMQSAAAAAIAGGHDAQAARSLSALVVTVGLRQGRFREGHDWARLAEAERARSNDPFVRGELPRNLGRLFLKEGKIEESRKSSLECLAIWERAFGPNDYAVAGVVTDLANAENMAGHYDKAKTGYLRSLATLEATFGPKSPALGPNVNNLGDVALATFEYEEATKQFERALALWEGGLGKTHPKVALALLNLAEAQALSGKAEKAIVSARRALEINTNAFGREHLDVALARSRLAVALRAARRLPEALKEATETLALHERLLGPKHPEVVSSLKLLAQIHLDLGERGLARPLLERAEKLANPEDTDAFELADIKFDLARSLGGKEKERGRALATEAKKTYREAPFPGAHARAEEIEAWLSRQ